MNGSTSWTVSILMVAAFAHAQNAPPWVRVATTGPGPREFHAMAYDSLRGKTVLFGGFRGNARLGDTWEWDGAEWSLRATAGPSPRGRHSMVFDSARGRTVLFSGSALPLPGRETWEWDGLAWSLCAPPGIQPPIEVGHAMAFDTARGLTVSFGGWDGSNEVSGTWEWDGGHWTTPAGILLPSGRVDHAMAFDSRRGVTVLFGGIAFPPAKRETWEYGTQGWVERVVVGGPTGREEHAMAYDPDARITLLMGGHDGFPSPPPNGKLWQWDGANWGRLSDCGFPEGFGPRGLVYDTRRRVFVSFGGPSGTTWERATTEGWCFANCDGSTGSPALNVNDFLCFLNRFAAGDIAANCDGSDDCRLDVNDFQCYMNAYSSGCP